MQTQLHIDAAPPTRSLWLHGPLMDLALGWCFLPIALVVHYVEPHTTAVQRLVGIIFLVSFAHQPLTLALVYGDPVQRAAHRSLYRWAPFAAIALIAIGLNVSLTLVALMAGLWNAEHTLMQRYGVLRIYGRKAGDQSGGFEKPMLIVWLVAAIAFIGAYADLNRLTFKLGVDGTNARSVHLMDHLRNPALVLFWTATVVGVAMLARWVRAERAMGRSASPAKHLYMAGTLGMVLAVMVDPIAGVAGYVAAHAIEYFAVVHRSLRTRTDDAPVAVATRTRPRRIGVYGAYFAGIVAIILFAGRLPGGHAYAYAILFFGALHILYDGFVWKLRRPSVAASLGITPVALPRP
jgi:uncharacterized membrane protein YidH (DUF202 family)